MKISVEKLKRLIREQIEENSKSEISKDALILWGWVFHHLGFNNTRPEILFETS